MVMASAGVNMPGGDGNPAAAAAGGGPECRFRRRRRLSPPPVAAATAGSSGGDPDPDAGAGPSRRDRARRPPSSSEEGSMYSSSVYEEETEEEEELPPMAPVGLALPAPGPEVSPVAFGSVALAGRMREMEDTISLHPSFYTWVDGTAMHFFAVFDGHGGTHVSALCRDQMHVILAEELAAEASTFLQQQRRRQRPEQGTSSSSSWSEEASWRSALSRAFARVDSLAALACACGQATVPRCACARSGITSAIVGSTAVVAVLAGARVVVANCGDSRAVLCRGPAGAPPVLLSHDHKPDRPDELARIESVGGQVINLNGPRVRGILAMSRALGDRFLRPEVISEPEITITQRTEADQCLILASDGMWDAISNETACAVARQCAAAAANAAPGADGQGPEDVCQATAAILARLALGRGSPDNVSVVIVDLQNRAG